MSFKPVLLSENTISSLKKFLQKQDNVFSFTENHFSSLLSCYMLMREIGGVNDDLSGFIYDMDIKQKINKKKIHIDLGTLSDVDGFSLRITYPGTSKILPSSPDLRHLLISRNNEIIISPCLIVDFMRSQSITPVFVKEWINRFYFSTFDIKNTSLKDQLCPLRYNDTFLYSKLVAQSQLIFHGTHDLAGHIVGLEQDGFLFAANTAMNIASQLDLYFGEFGYGNLPSHLIPFMIGLLLDDLTQKPSYFSTSRVNAIEALLQSLDKSLINPRAPLMLYKFPEKFNIALQSVRNQPVFSLAAFNEHLTGMIMEITEVSRLVTQKKQGQIS